jgi:hypothetical protein
MFNPCLPSFETLPSLHSNSLRFKTCDIYQLHLLNLLIFACVNDYFYEVLMAVQRVPTCFWQMGVFQGNLLLIKSSVDCQGFVHSCDLISNYRKILSQHYKAVTISNSISIKR